MKWKIPPMIKVYEALGCIADDRLEFEGIEGRVYSSSRRKFYTIRYEPKSNSIMVNDNGSYYIDYLGYPAIAYLMKVGELDFSEEYSNALKGIHWKDLNLKHDRSKGVGIPDYDFDSVIEEVDLLVEKKGINIVDFKRFLEKVLEQIKSKDLNLLGEKELPPKGY
ncbi:MAG: hypothetical protein PHH06_00995 [Candidatus Gracilibacteria bacterium]|nr:hypothetical protein [Candidatus Gracilibacteria bacterium]